MKKKSVVPTSAVPKPSGLCVDGKTHNFKAVGLGSGYSKPYYEHLRIEEVEEPYTEYPRKDDGNYDYSKPIHKQRKVMTTVDDEPGKHYTNVYCSKCGESREILVKSHGDKYMEQMSKLTEEERSQLKRNGKLGS